MCVSVGGGGGAGGVPLACALSDPQICYFWQSGRILHYRCHHYNS